MPSPPVFLLGRQPILDRAHRTVAYELLFRANREEAGEVSDGLRATTTVISHAFSALGVDAVLGSCRGFINFDAETLLSDVVELLPPDRTVVELLETVVIDDAIVQRCRDLHAAGFRFALDDVVQLGATHQALLPLIEIVKVDIQATPPEQIPGLVRQARQAGVQLLAEKVDSQARADWCRDLGFDLFQGYYMSCSSCCRKYLPGRIPRPSRTLSSSRRSSVTNSCAW
jgi:c-di-GMP-related signal transduction protein